MNDLNPQTPPSAARKTERPKVGAEYIHEERLRVIEKHGYNLDHDRNEHPNGQLAQAAICYATLAAGQSRAAGFNIDPQDVTTLSAPKQWPFAGQHWKPSNNRLKNLVRAGQFIAAEIERLIADGNKLPAESEEEPKEEASAT